MNISKLEETIDRKLKEAAQYLYEKIKQKREGVELKGTDIILPKEVVDQELGTPTKAPDPQIEKIIRQEEEHFKEFFESL